MLEQPTISIGNNGSWKGLSYTTKTIVFGAQLQSLQPPMFIWGKGHPQPLYLNNHILWNIQDVCHASLLIHAAFGCFSFPSLYLNSINLYWKLFGKVIGSLLLIWQVFSVVETTQNKQSPHVKTWFPRIKGTKLLFNHVLESWCSLGFVGL